MTTGRYNPLLHGLALATACATFPLIFMGGLVTSHKAGMSVPDWPNSYGYNMFLFPPRLWIGGILYEHTHRLMATVVGMLAIGLTINAWWTEIQYGFRLLASSVHLIDRPQFEGSPHPRYVRWLATSVLFAVIFQGVLGGLRVVLVRLNLAIVHACVAQAFFCLAALAAIVTSRWWIEGPAQHTDGEGRRVAIVGAVATAMIYLQLIVGATMRHYDAGLAIPDFPLAYGHVLPPTNETELAAANAERLWHLNLDAVTLPQIWLHFGHRIGALCVTLGIAAVVFLVLRGRRKTPLVWPAVLLAGLLAVQITLGILTVLLRKPADVASTHVAVGALTLVCTFVLTVRAFRMYAAVPTGKYETAAADDELSSGNSFDVVTA